METKKVNRFGRTFSQGVTLDHDLKSLIVDTILKEGVASRVIFPVLLRNCQDGFVSRARQ